MLFKYLSYLKLFRFKTYVHWISSEKQRSRGNDKSTTWIKVELQIPGNDWVIGTSILQQAEPPEPNITKDMREALKILKEDESIMVLPADKGRANVVKGTDTYRAKMSTLIENGP